MVPWLHQKGEAMQVGDPVKVKTTNFKCDLLGIKAGALGIVTGKEVNMSYPNSPYICVLMANGDNVVFMQYDLEIISD